MHHQQVAPKTHSLSGLSKVRGSHAAPPRSTSVERTTSLHLAPGHSSGPRAYYQVAPLITLSPQCEYVAWASEEPWPKRDGGGRGNRRAGEGQGTTDAERRREYNEPEAHGDQQGGSLTGGSLTAEERAFVKMLNEELGRFNEFYIEKVRGASVFRARARVLAFKDGSDWAEPAADTSLGFLLSVELRGTRPAHALRLSAAELSTSSELDPPHGGVCLPRLPPWARWASQCAW